MDDSKFGYLLGGFLCPKEMKCLPKVIWLDRDEAWAKTHACLLPTSIFSTAPCFFLGLADNTDLLLGAVVIGLLQFRGRQVSSSWAQLENLLSS